MMSTGITLVILLDIVIAVIRFDSQMITPVHNLRCLLHLKNNNNILTLTIAQPKNHDLNEYAINCAALIHSYPKRPSRESNWTPQHPSLCPPVCPQCRTHRGVPLRQTVVVVLQEATAVLG